MEINENKKNSKKSLKTKHSKESNENNCSSSQKAWNELEEILEGENMDLFQNEVTKQKNLPEQIKDYYKVISIDNTSLPSKKKIICQKFINFYGEQKDDILIDNTKTIIYLQDFWAQTFLFPNDTVFISALYDKS